MAITARYSHRATAILLLGVALVARTAGAEGFMAPRAASVIVETEDGAAFQFKSISGLSVEIEVIEFSEGTGPTIIRKLPGRVKYPNLVLKGGFTANSEFFQWIEAIRQGQLVRKNLIVTLVDGRNRPVARYKLINAWPAKWEASNDESRANDVFVETITIVHEGFQRV